MNNCKKKINYPQRFDNPCYDIEKIYKFLNGNDPGGPYISNFNKYCQKNTRVCNKKNKCNCRESCSCNIQNSSCNNSNPANSANSANSSNNVNSINSASNSFNSCTCGKKNTECLCNHTIKDIETDDKNFSIIKDILDNGDNGFEEISENFERPVTKITTITKNKSQDKKHSTFKEALFNATFVNGSCCIKCDGESKTSMIDYDNCPHGHQDKSTSTIYQLQEIDIDENSNVIAIPFSFINICNGCAFDYDSESKNISIKEPGFYSMTYNITYHGSIYNFLARVTTFQRECNCVVGKIIPTSVSKCNNRPVCDAQSAEFYNCPCDVEDVVNTCNFTFFFCLKEGNICNLLLNLKFPPTNYCQKIFIHPIKTWINIQKLV